MPADPPDNSRTGRRLARDVIVGNTSFDTYSTLDNSNCDANDAGARSGIEGSKRKREAGAVGVQIGGIFVVKTLFGFRRAQLGGAPSGLARVLRWARVRGWQHEEPVVGV